MQAVRDSNRSSYNRREWLRFLIGSTLVFAGGSPPSRASTAVSAPSIPRLTLSPELTEGPYYIDLERIRRDITENKPGVPLRLRLAVIDDRTGAPMPNAAVDVWHCDAQGVYSGFSAHGPGPGGPGSHLGSPGFSASSETIAELSGAGPMPPFPHRPGLRGDPHFTHKPDNNQTFLRGVQITNEDGIAEIKTIFPGWYMGRTTHIHVRVHLGGRVADGRYRGGRITHTGQLFFPEALTARVDQLAAYRKPALRKLSQQNDGIFREGGSHVTAVTLVDPSRLEAGLVSESRLVINPSADNSKDAGPA